jgi:hypothetical protein
MKARNVVMSFYVKTFLISGIALGLFFHAVTTESMPWWPDTAIVGAFMGALGVITAYQHTRDRRAWRRWRALARETRVWLRTRNTV